jgi:anti-sigma B factor antagonist
MESYPVRRFGAWAIVGLPAEVDMSNSERLHEQLLAVIGEGATDMVVDMSGTTFCDSSGIHALLRARKRVVSQGGRLHVVASSRSVLRLFDLLGLSTLVNVYPTVAAALSAGTALAAGPGQPAGADPVAGVGPAVPPGPVGPVGPSASGASTAGEGTE